MHQLNISPIEENQLENLVTLSEVKNYLKIDHIYEDHILKETIGTAVDYLEKYTGKMIVQRNLHITTMSYGRKTFIFLPSKPIISITSVKINNVFRQSITLNPDKDYRFDPVSHKLTMDHIYCRTTSPVEIEAIGGLAQITPELKHLLMLYISSIYELRNINCLTDMDMLNEVCLRHREINI